MITARLSLRNDAAGAGHFGAPRGSRTHKGQDYAATIEAPVSGKVTKLGYPYGSGYGGASHTGEEETYRYVEITDTIERRHRVFYIQPDPAIKVGDFVSMGDPIGVLQAVTSRYPQYPAMTVHSHYEIMLPDGSCVDPVEG